MDDASLDEFVDAGDDGDADGGPADGTATDPSDTPADVDPAASTYAWSGDGAVCGACGESVARRWRDGAELVCADCKEW